ncbi:MAG: response regulator [Acidobacteriota bacterium]
MHDTDLRILIVEDEPPLAELERIALEGVGYQIEDVGRGDLGLDKLNNGSIDLVLLDYKLPDMTGLDFVAALGDRIELLPVVVVTGYADAKLAVDLLKAGAADYVIKDTELVFLQQLPKLVRATAERFELKARIEKQAQDLVEQSRALEEAKRQADQANRAKTEFLTNLSHEIRTPMTAILGFVDILMADETIRQAPAARMQDLLAIKDNGSYLLELLDDILDLSKVETGKLAIARRRFNLAKFLDDVIALVRVRCAKKGLVLELDHAGAIPETIETDSTRLRQILLNLLGNAVKFTEVGSVRLVARLLSDSAEPTLELAVTDTGIGIPEEVLPHLFEPFSQADPSSTRRFSGTGLGLSLCGRLARLLGGTITVDSEPGRGSTFRVTLPIGSQEGVSLIDDLERATRPTPIQPPEEPENKIAGRFLLAEDNPVNQVLTVAILKAAGADVTVAENGQQALDLALRAEKERPFDLVLMDLQMPVVDGYQATRELRAQGFTRPILALTAHAMQGHHEKSLAAGCDGHLTKPIDRDELINAIAEAL